MVDKLLGLHNQIRIFHWQTASYAEHKALGKAYEALDPLIDSFIEGYMGDTGKKIQAGFKLTLVDHKNKASTDLMNQAIAFLTEELETEISGKTELLNIHDEMLSVIKQTKYLLTLG